MVTTNVKDDKIRVANVEAERSLLDEEIAQLEAQLLKLRIRRNALATINQLPTELLGRIMEEYRDRVLPCSWMEVTRVCRYWRDAALQSPRLWTRILCPQMPPSLIQLHISNSGRAPLSVSVKNTKVPSTHWPSNRYWERAALLLTGVEDRVFEYKCRDRLEGGGAWNWDKLVDCQFSTSPMKRLEFECTDVYKDWKPTFDLEYLSITGGSCKTAFLSQSLVTLVLKYLNKKTLPPMLQFYKMLSSITNLQHLTLHEILSGMAGRQVNKPENVRILPSLAVLELQDDTEKAYMDFFSHMDLPHLRKLSILLPKYESPSVLIQNSLTTLWPKISAVHSQHELHLKMDVDSPFVFSLSLAGDNDKPIFRLGWSMDLPTDALFKTVLAYVPQERLTSVDLSWHYDQPSSFLNLASLLSVFPALTHVRLQVPYNIIDCTPSCECIRNYDSRQFESKTAFQPPHDPLPACSACQQFAASFFPAMRVLSLRIQNLQKLNRDAITRLLAHRSDCSRPLERLSIGDAWLVEGPNPTLEYLKSKGDVVIVL